MGRPKASTENGLKREAILSLWLRHVPNGKDLGTLRLMLDAYAQSVRDDERERCAKICEGEIRIGNGQCVNDAFASAIRVQKDGNSEKS
jgi:hypothetical protein